MIMTTYSKLSNFKLPNFVGGANLPHLDVASIITSCQQCSITTEAHMYHTILRYTEYY